LAILGGYGGLVVLYKVKSAISSKPAIKAAPAASGNTPAEASSEDSVPPVDSPAFDKYVESDAFYKMLEDEVKLTKLVESL
jgi:hypothetical protein